MKILVANHSSYPKVGEGLEGQQLRRAIERFDRKEISEETLEKVIGQTIAQVIAEQEQAGIDLVTDGQIRWFDPVSHWLKGFKGIRLGGLVRFFDTNRYYRVPRIEGPLEERESSSIRRDLSLATATAKRPVKAILTGPVTLATLSQMGSGFKKIEDLMESLLTRLCEEMAELTSGGAACIQIEEPIILKQPQWIPFLSYALKKISEKKGRILLATYFGDATPLYERFQDLPVDGLGFDCFYGPQLLKKIAQSGSDKTLALGVVDGRTTRLEEVDPLVKKLAPLKKVLGERDLHLTTSSGLDYLPKDKALEKLRLLVRIKERIS